MYFIWHIKAKSVGEKQEHLNPAVFCHSPGADSWMKSGEQGKIPSVARFVPGSLQ